MKFFNSKENQEKAKAKDCLRRRHRSRLNRDKVNRELTSDKQKLAFTSAYSEVLASIAQKSNKNIIKY